MTGGWGRKRSDAFCSIIGPSHSLACILQPNHIYLRVGRKISWVQFWDMCYLLELITLWCFGNTSVYVWKSERMCGYSHKTHSLYFSQNACASITFSPKTCCNIQYIITSWCISVMLMSKCNVTFIEYNYIMLFVCYCGIITFAVICLGMFAPFPGNILGISYTPEYLGRWEVCIPNSRLRYLSDTV